MTARMLQGDVLSVLPTLPADHYDCAVTSPPYWMLRDYGTGTWEGGNDLMCDHTVPQRGIHLNRGRYEAYTDTCGKCGARRIDRQLGLEATPDAYIANMVRVFREVRRVLAPHGVCWCNIGDTYENGGSLALIPDLLRLALRADGWIVRSVVVWHKPAPMPGSFNGWRWQRCRVKVKEGGRNERPLDGTGWAPTADGYSRPGGGGGNGLATTSIGKAQWTDCPGCPKCLPHGGYVLRRGSWRCTSSWEPLLMLVKSGRYYGDGEAVKTPCTGQQHARLFGKSGNGDRKDGDRTYEGDAAGANLRDVWTIAAEPLGAALCPGCGHLYEDGKRLIRLVPGGPRQFCRLCKAKVDRHYAAFPTELVYRCLASSTSQRGYCPECGAPWCRVVETESFNDGYGVSKHRSNGDRKDADTLAGNMGVLSRTLGWRPSCSCHYDHPCRACNHEGNVLEWPCPHCKGERFEIAEPRPARVLDPFAGSGRVGIQALRMGLDFTGVELSSEYVAMVRRILAEESPLFGGME